MSFIRMIAGGSRCSIGARILMEDDVEQVFSNQAVRDVYLGKQVAA